MSGALAGFQRHVVVIKIDGPRTEEQYNAFKKELDALLKRHKAKVVLKGRGKKSAKGG